MVDALKSLNTLLQDLQSALKGAVRVVEKAWLDIPLDERRAYVGLFNDMQEPKKLRLRWIEQLAEVTDRIAGGEDDWVVRSVFWLRLVAVRTELLPHIADDPDEQFFTGEVRKRLQAVDGAVSNEEWLVVEYLRHIEAHTYAGAFLAKIDFHQKDVRLDMPVYAWEGKQRVEKERQLTHEVTERRNKILEEQGGDAGFAKMLAARLKPLTQDLDATAKKFPGAML
jgi:hypothetical protein